MPGFAADLARPAQADLDKCVHCGLCLNACPTYRELGVEMDSPRGRLYQMNAVANGAPITPGYLRHIDSCLACRACETACPSGVPYGRIVEAARAQIEIQTGPQLRNAARQRFLLNHVVASPAALQIAGAALYVYQRSGLQLLLRALGLFGLSKRLAGLEALTPGAEAPFFFGKYGRTYPAIGQQRYRVAFLAGCIANVAFARLNEATVRVLQHNGCQVSIPPDQNCCGALHLHSGLRSEAQNMARRNIDAMLDGNYDAVIANAAGCGSALKEYDHILASDPSYAAKARRFSALVKDVTEFLAALDLNRNLGSLNVVATYQDSCHLLHGQKVSQAPRTLLRAIPGLELREMPMSDSCCGSAGIYNLLHNDMASRLLDRKMQHVATTKASLLATANPGCILQLRAGVQLHRTGQRVAHVVELLDEAYARATHA